MRGQRAQTQATQAGMRMPQFISKGADVLFCVNDDLIDDMHHDAGMAGEGDDTFQCISRLAGLLEDKRADAEQDGNVWVKARVEEISLYGAHPLALIQIEDLDVEAGRLHAGPDELRPRS
jgi:hypothetical protein